MGLFTRNKRDKRASETEYDIREPRAAHADHPRPPPSYHGPHFEKGPAQEAIWNSRRENHTVTPEDIRGRSHSFHDPIRHHEYSSPYEKRPVPWTARMDEEYAHYRQQCKSNADNKRISNAAKDVKVGKNIVPEASHGSQIRDGIEKARAGIIQANRGGQERAGFMNKYPRAYGSSQAIEDHEKQVGQQRKSAANYRNTEGFLKTKYQQWESRMRETR
ncbi:uncharacterized protein N7482_000345 [Penicillium canariense]|uniref:Uncharacterized protein n=1 Tax=Penicillium canariense TaxID=189055 RepID=A0A9W9LRX8_9EURO|nr:uncharacterized protein N7482_000345 [Penicillium canariense]KAJ5174468.1 hypothetical protein N7482_000345 [Penicillium canariense]